ncbi:hypothetical protein GCM10023231_18740 [Olivibacter ginsenosidimutans]|uniref:BT-3987-like N-terminal domain-containing protein n=1 Tax=Olivibacter ginsenosidimutans TaxID=1176537 RepID=A0ABP9B6U7_9SPHI
MMKQLLIYRIIAACLICVVALFACKDEVNLPDQPLADYAQIYMPQAVNGPVNKTLTRIDEPQLLIYGADFGGQDYPTTDISVTFSVSQASVDSFNVANNTNYVLLPASKYKLSAETAVIPSGKLATDPLTIAIFTGEPNAMDPATTYLLPISITESSFQVNEKLRTTYFILRVQSD